MRRELVVALQFVIHSFLHNFLSLLRAVMDEENNNDSHGGHRLGGNISRLGTVACNMSHVTCTYGYQDQQ